MLLRYLELMACSFDCHFQIFRFLYHTAKLFFWLKFSVKTIEILVFGDWLEFQRICDFAFFQNGRLDILVRGIPAFLGRCLVRSSPVLHVYILS